MIVCSCTEISDRDIESALLEILGAPDAPIPTPGIVYRHLAKRMNCCSCAPLAVETIYNKVDALEKNGLISPTLSATTRSKLLEFCEYVYMQGAANAGQHTGWAGRVAAMICASWAYSPFEDGIESPAPVVLARTRETKAQVLSLRTTRR